MIIDEVFAKTKVVPVVVIDDSQRAAPLAEAMVAGGLPIAEVTFRTDAAEDSIRIMSQYPDMIVGAGTILNEEQAERAIDAGAKFVVLPGMNADVVRFCQSKNVPVFPGATSATEMMEAIALGLNVVKFFPAEANGGAAAIKDYTGPFGNLRFMPTGGVSPQNIGEYLAVPQIIAVGGTWMVPKQKISNGEFGDIKELCHQTISMIENL